MGGGEADAATHTFCGSSTVSVYPQRNFYRYYDIITTRESEVKERYLWVVYQFEDKELKMVTEGLTGKNLVDRFNSFFEGSAKIEINGSNLEIAIGSQTLIISLPEIIGVDSRGQ